MAERLDKVIDSLFTIKGFIVSIVLILVSHIIPDQQSLWFFSSGIIHFIKSVVRDTGIAVFIMVGIAVTLDRRHRIRFLGEIDQQIANFRSSSFQALFGWFIPFEYLNEVEKQIFTANFIREDCEVSYTLRNIPEDIKQQIDETCDLNTERIIMEVRSKSKIRNIKLEPLPYSFRFFVEKEDAPNFNRVYLVNITNVEGVTQTYNDEELKTFLNPADIINNSYIMPERIIQPNETVEVDVRFRAIRAYPHTREVFLSLLMTRDMAIRIRCDIPGLIIFCETIAPQRLQEIPITDPGSAYCTEKCWRIYKPLLPYQGFMLWWHKTNSDGS